MLKFLVCLLFFLSLGVSAMAAEFTYDVQRAGYAFNKSDKMGALDQNEFVEVFRSFPWRDQVGQANGGAEPTINVNNLSAKTSLFVSVAGSSTEYKYILGIVYMKHKAPLLGVISRQPVKWVDMYVTGDPAVVERIFGIFFSSNQLETHAALEHLEKFDSQPAPDES